MIAIIAFLVFVSACGVEQSFNPIDQVEATPVEAPYDSPPTEVDMKGALRFTGHWVKDKHGLHFVMDKTWHEGDEE